jgi:hypothetical protein
MLPSQHGAKLCEDMCQAYRSISIALANHRDDYITSERALKAAENFNVSETTKGRLVADRTTIEGLINREIKKKQEEEDTKKRHTVKLNLKNWFRERTLEITPNKFSWGKETILAEKINGVRFGINAENSNSILSVHDIDGKIITTEWLSGNNFKTAVTSATALYSSIILEKLLNIINGGGEIVIGLATVDKSGIRVPTGSTNQRLYPITYLFKWHQVHAEIASGSIVLKSIKTKSKNAIQFSLFSDDRNFTFMISCRDNWNAFLLPFLIKIMKPEAQKNEDRYYAEQKRASDKNKEERLQEAMIKVKRGEMHEIEYVLLKQRLDEIY